MHKFGQESTKRQQRGCVAFQHVHDELFLDGLSHRVFVERFTIATKDFQSLVFGSCSESEQAEIGLAAPLGYASVEFVVIGNPFLLGILGRFLSQTFTA